MLVSKAIGDAEVLKITRPTRHPIELHFEWAGHPRSQLLRCVTAIRSLLSDLFGCEVTVVGIGPGCFFAIYAVPLPLARFEEVLARGAREELGDLVDRFEARRVQVKTPGRTRTVF